MRVHNGSHPGPGVACRDQGATGARDRSQPSDLITRGGSRGSVHKLGVPGERPGGQLGHDRADFGRHVLDGFPRPQSGP